MPTVDLRRLGLASAAVLAIACAAGPAAAQATDPDPLEGLNRKFFALNAYLDRTIIRPAALAWKENVPAPVRSAVRNFVTNLSETVVFANDVLQVRPTDAARSGTRFVVNSTLGVGGLADVAKAGGIPRHDNSFGNTLGRVFKAGPGAYLYLPVLGPTSIRDGFGQIVDTLFTPLTWVRYEGQIPVGLAIGVSGGLNARADADTDLQAIRNQATDEYATLRSLYLQNRAAQIAGKPVDVNALPDFDDPNAPAVAAPGSVSPTGTPPRSNPGPVAPAGDAGALPRPSPPTTESGPPQRVRPGDIAADVGPGAPTVFYGGLANELAQGGGLSSAPARGVFYGVLADQLAGDRASEVRAGS